MIFSRPVGAVAAWPGCRSLTCSSWSKRVAEPLLPDGCPHTTASLPCQGLGVLRPPSSDIICAAPWTQTLSLNGLRRWAHGMPSSTLRTLITVLGESSSEANHQPRFRRVCSRDATCHVHALAAIVVANAAVWAMTSIFAARAKMLAGADVWELFWPDSALDEARPVERGTSSQQQALGRNARVRL